MIKGEQLTWFGEDDPAYTGFVDKFKPKKTTDDCYTPANIYEAVADWVAKEYGLDKSTFVRPFWPGGDFETFDYPDGATVVDNPPFSIRARILSVYMRRGIRFFLFSPALSLITREPGVCHIAAGVPITYENGAEVPTSFVTNLDSCILRSAPDLYQKIKAVNRLNEKLKKKELPKYSYPDHVVTAAICQYFSQHGTEYRLEPSDCVRILGLDAQKAAGKSVFGGGLLLSEKAAAEKAAAEKAAAEKAAAEKAAATRWKLSDREMEIVRRLGK